MEQLQFQKIAGLLNPADVLTKPLDSVAMKRSLQEAGCYDMEGYERATCTSEE